MDMKTRTDLGLVSTGMKLLLAMVALAIGTDGVAYAQAVTDGYLPVKMRST